MRVPPIFEPSQAFRFGSLDFVADWLSILHLREETRDPAPVGGTSSIDSRTCDFDDAASALHSEQTLCSNPTVSNVHAIIYLLFSIFRQLPGGMPLSLPRPPYGRFPYGLVSPADAYARGLQRMPTPPLSRLNSWGWRATLPPISSTSWMTMSGVTAPASVTWHLATVRPGSALWRTL